MQSTLANAGQQDKAATYTKQINALKGYRQELSTLIQAQGAFNVSQQKVTSATESFNDAVRKNKVGINDLVRNFGLLKQAQKEQAALQSAMGATWASSTPGKVNVDLFIPKTLTSSMNDIRQRYGYINSVISSIATQTINWGKNTQWAGRQIMVGITVPLGIAAAGMAKLTYDTDVQLTRLAKVYDLQSQAATTGANQQAGAERELAALRENSFNQAIELANKYGQAVTDTLEIQANLAATGLSGQSLTKITAEVSRIASLGELTTQQATDMAVALKTAFRLTDEGVVKFDNYANAVENATSLSIQDIAEATPRAASALAGLGVSAEEMTVLMVSMKEAGVDAAEGANALKSATTRILNPTRQAVNIFKQYGINLRGIVDETQGNLFETLQKLGPAMSKMTDYQKQQAIAALFGTYQFNRLNAALANVSDSSTQAGKAMELMGKSEEELAAISAGELEKAANSASGKFKRYVEGIKGELAKMGQPVLEAINPILDGLNKVFAAFNGLDDGTKKFTLIGLAAVGLIGPIMMLIGVFGNLIGSALKGASVISNIFLRFKMMTAEEKAAEMASRRLNNVFDAQAASAENLARSIGMLNTKLEQYQREAGGITAAKGLDGGLIGQGQTTNMRRNARGQIIYGAGSKDANGKSIGGRGVSADDRAKFEALEKGSDTIATNAAKTEKHWGKIAGFAGALSVAGIAIGSMETGSQDIANSFMTIASVVSVAAMIPWGTIASKAKQPLESVKTSASTIKTTIAQTAIEMATGFKNADKSAGRLKATGGTAFKGMAAGARSLGPVLASAAAALGPVGIAATALAGAAAAGYVLYQWSQKTRKEWDAIVSGAETVANIVGVTGELQTFEPLTGEKQDSAIDVRNNKVKELRDNNEALVDSYKKLNNADLMNVAVSAGLDVKFRGGTEEQVKQAIEVVLAAAGKDGGQIDNLMLSVKDVDFDNPEAVAALINQTLGETLDSAKSKNKKRNWWNIFLDEGELTQGAAGSAKLAASTFYTQFATAADDSARGALLKGFNDTLEKDTKDLMANINAIQAFNRQSAFGGAGDVMRAINKEMIANNVNIANRKELTVQANTEIAKSLGLNKQQLSQLNTQAALEREVAREFYKRTNPEATDKQINAIETLEDVSKGMGIAIQNSAGANKSLENTSKSATSALQDQTQATEELADANRKEIVSAMQQAMGGTMSAVFEKAADQMESEHDAAIDGIKARGDRAVDALEARADAANDRFEARKDAMQAETERQKDELKKSQKLESRGFEKQWDQMMKDHDKAWDNRVKVEEDAYDARIKAIEDEIDAEEKAEEVRQKLFDAEISRIQRMSQMFNTNIDFNAALNSGNLDEAAKLASTSAATQMQWSIEDQRATGTSALEQKKTALNAQKDQLQSEKEDRIAALKELQVAEKEVLDARKEQESDLLQERQDNAQKALDVERDRLAKALDAEKDAYNKGVAANKDRLQKRTQAQTDAANQEFKTRKNSLEMELATLKAFTPRNRAELDAHIEKVKQTYAKYGVSLKTSGDEWSRFIGTALQNNVETARVGMADKRRWEELGNQITDGMAAAFDVTGDQLMTWLKTGIYPAQTTVTGGGKKTAGKTGQTARHTGGGIGWSSKDRTGVPRSASLYPSETTAVVKRGEFIMNEKASRANAGILTAMNKGSWHTGGPVGSIARHEGGFGSIATGLAASVGKAIAYSIGQTLTTELAESAFGGMYGVAEAGKFGNSNLDSEQLLNASKIMNVGKNLGASSRDIMIALMTALQESSLRNLAGGDRDSLGLFQQRPSQGWGTVAQIRDPEYAATKFYEALFKVQNRDSLAPTVAAQKVQRSAFPQAYAKWQDEALAIMSATPIASAVNSQLTGAIGAGGRTIELLQQMMARSGMPYRVTSTTGGQHAAASYHYKGQAIDVAGARPGVDTPEMAAIAQYLYRNYGKGLAELIYGGPGGVQLKNGRAFNYSSGILQSHRNHVHVAATPDSLRSLGIPGLAVGGEIRYDNTIANLHKNEKVLTAPLSAKLDEGIDNMIDGGNTYQITVDLRGATVTDDTIKDIEKVVRKVIDDRENRNGRNRVVGRT